MSRQELENLIKRDGYISNFKILSLCSDEELDNITNVLDEMLTKKLINTFLKDGIYYYKEAARNLC